MDFLILWCTLKQLFRLDVLIKVRENILFKNVFILKWSGTNIYQVHAQMGRIAEKSGDLRPTLEQNVCM